MKPIRKIEPALLEKFGEPPKPREPVSAPEKPVEKIGGEPPKVTEPKPIEPSKPTVPEALTKRSAAPKVLVTSVARPVTAPRSGGPSTAIRAVRWEDKLTTLAKTAAADLPNDFKYVRAGVQDVTDPAKMTSFVKALDPFGLLKAPPATTASANAKYKALDAKQWQSYFAAVSITGPVSRGVMGGRPAPNERALDRAVAMPGDTASGVPRLQHAIWVGGPLNADVAKQKAFMDRLVEKAEGNPGWDVCLWTDQPRTEMLAAPAESPLGKYRDWAATNNIKLIPVDEVFAGDGAMQLQGMYKLEQVKGGTGRAAASDLLRLEIIHRFGGVYCDGDKPINTPLNDIAKYTSQQGGYTTAQEAGSFQNCGMCGIPGNALVTKVIETIRANYGKPRDNLLPKQRQNRPTRFEVIMRTGPSVVRDLALADERLDQQHQATSKYLMPKDFITPPAVYTTSWDPSIVPCYGDRDLGAAVQNKVKVESAADARDRVAKDVSALRKKMQAKRPAVSLTPVEDAAQVAAVQKAVTALVYGVWNNDGHFNLDLAEQHIKSAPDRDLAREMVLKVFADKKMADVAKQVKTVQLPGNAPTKETPPSAIPLPESTLDTLFLGTLFPYLKVENFTLQHAAYLGNTQFIDYAREHRLLDLSTGSSRTLETGQRMQGDREYATANMNVLVAALRGGQRDVLAQLSGNPEFGGLTDPAAASGQLDTLLWAVHALLTNSRGSDKLAALAQTLLSLKRPSLQDVGTVMIDLSDDEALYLFNQFAEGLQKEIGASPDMKSQAFTGLYQKTIEKGRPKLAARMETLGASLSNLSPTNRDALRNQLTGGGVDLPVWTKQYLQLAQKAGLVADTITAASARQVPNLDTVKNDYGTVHTDPENSTQLLEYLAKGLAYAQSHIDDKNAGRSTRVDGWRNGVGDVVNLLNAIPSADRKPEQAALLDAATQVSAKLQAMKRSAFVS